MMFRHMSDSMKMCKISLPITRLKNSFEYIESIEKSLKICVIKSFSILTSIPKFEHFLCITPTKNEILKLCIEV